MELDELHVGDRRTRAIGHGDAIAGRDVGVRRVEVHLPRPAGAEERGACAHRVDVAGGAIEHVRSPADGGVARVIDQQVDREMVLENAYLRRGAHRFGEGADDLVSGGVERVQDASLRVTALLPEVVRPALAVLVAVEAHAEVDQLADAGRALAHDDLHDVAMTEARARAERVRDVRLERVVRAPDRGDTALGVLAGALRQAVLGDEQDAAPDAQRKAQVSPAMPLPTTRKSASIGSGRQLPVCAQCGSSG